MKKIIVSFVLFGLLAATTTVRAVRWEKGKFKKQSEQTGMNQNNRTDRLAYTIPNIQFTYFRHYLQTNPGKMDAAMKLMRFLSLEKGEQPEEISEIVETDPELAEIVNMTFFSLTGRTKRLEISEEARERYLEEQNNNKQTEENEKS